MGRLGHYLCTGLGIFLGLGLFMLASQSLADVNLDQAGMGRNTVPREGVFENDIISSVGAPAKLFPGWQRFRSEDVNVGLWLGASQIYCINNIQPDDRLAVEYLNGWAREENQSLRMLQLTAPNGNLHELLAFYLASRQQGYTPHWLAIGLVYDDLREEQIRDTFLEDLQPLSKATLELGGLGAAQLEAARAAMSDPEEQADPVARNPTDGTPQERLEAVLVQSLEDHLPGYAHRQNLTGQFKVTLRAGLSRMLGQVSQRRVPKVPEARKQWNHEALKALVQIARADGCQILIYKPPHRQSEGPFYHDRASYDAYFAMVSQWLEPLPEVTFLDLETLVPPEHWGVTNWGRPDVFHFTVEGHRRLAEAMQSFFSEKLTRSDNALQ